MAEPISRYPLQWPAGWKRLSAFQRQDAKFSKYDRRLTVHDGLTRVLDELKRLGVHEDYVVVSTNLETRLDGMPRNGQAEPIDPGASVYWVKNGMRSGNPMQCMAIDRYTKVADNLAAIAATLEAMRAIERHGGAAILDRAFTGFTALPAPIAAGMKRPWRDVLGLQHGVPLTADDVRSMYRHYASIYHPDKGTGDPAKMAELNVARDEALEELHRG